jgi:hypothetical protein
VRDAWYKQSTIDLFQEETQSATTMPTTLRFNCLIEGEDIVFPVTAVCDDVVGDLKEFIQSE